MRARIRSSWSSGDKWSIDERISAALIARAGEYCAGGQRRSGSALGALWATMLDFGGAVVGGRGVRPYIEGLIYVASRLPRASPEEAPAPRRGIGERDRDSVFIVAQPALLTAALLYHSTCSSKLAA